jgi:hypothetical protein
MFGLFDELERLDPPTSPKEFNFEIIRAQFACDMNERWHSRLPLIHWSNVVRNTHYVCYGAFYKGEIYAIAIWSSPVAQNRFTYGKQMLELRRMAISQDCPKNTATRMLSFMRKDIQNRFDDVAMLISYQDTAVHIGTIYKADNWIAVHESPGLEWNTEKRSRSVEQSLAPKIRWEYKIRDYVPLITVSSDVVK